MLIVTKSKRCKEYGVKLIVDAMSRFAGMPIDVASVGIDFLISSSNKCIQGMAGLSFVISRRDELEAPEGVPPRSYYLNLPQQHFFLERTRQMQFTPPVQMVYALEQALTEYEAEGAEGRHTRYIKNIEALDSGMRLLGFERLLPDAVLSRILTAYIEPDHRAYSFEAMYDELYRRGFTIYPGTGANRATFRLANMGDVTQDDMREVVQAMKEPLDRLGVDPLYSGESERHVS